MPYNSNTLFQKMPDKVSFFYAQISKKWLELSLKKFSSYIFKNNGESETVLYLTNGRKRSWTKSLAFFDERKHFHGIMGGLFREKIKRRQEWIKKITAKSYGRKINTWC